MATKYRIKPSELEPSELDGKIGIDLEIDVTPYGWKVISIDGVPYAYEEELLEIVDD